MENLPTDHFAVTSAYTPHVFRDQYPAIDPTSDVLSQAGKIVIITGASAGIGARGLAPAFAKARAKAIILVARSQSKLDNVAEELKTKYPDVEFLTFSLTVSNEAEVAALYRTIESKFGHADVLVNNAGASADGSMIASSDPSKWWTDFEVNVKGPFLMSQGFLSLLGTKNPGTIITTNTGIAAMVAPTMSSYSISKNASARLMEYVATEHPNVNAISVQPGVVLTNMTAESFKRFALDTPELIGGTAVWLSTGAAQFLTGRFISANWSVDDLMEQKDKIVASNDLKMVYQGNFGLDQFNEEERK